MSRDETQRAHRPTRPGPEAEHRLELLRQMTRIRLFEERCVELYSATKIRGFLHVGSARRPSRRAC